mmetsp:Transcript_12297/g.27638  ORF Transcript_12297/g.27638 Transcript_12297/m.27638 type:complete len:569 (+) Transcript_12297:2-1708(+)
MSTVKDRFQRQGRGRRGRKRDVGQTDRTKIFESGGQSDLVGDNLSDANASLGGANEYSFGPPVSAFAMGEEVDDSSKPTFSSEKCKKCSLTVLVIVLMLTTVIGVGMHLIFGRLPEETAASPENDVSNIASFADQSSSPTAIPKFAVFVMPSITPTPSPTSPTHSPSDVKSLDETLLKIQGTTKENLFDINTPEGKGRDWILNSDRMINVEEEQKTQQRYILSVLYFATNGLFWMKNNTPVFLDIGCETNNWLDAMQSECNWCGVTCTKESNIVQRIDLSTNNVTGALPNEIASLSNLQALNVSRNQLSGTIPTQVFDLLDKLETLDLHGNQITGTIPERTISVSDSRLRYLNLGINQLTGYLPFFSNAEFIIFKKNLLTSFDSRYSTSSALQKFKGYHNQLMGSLPSTWNTPDLVEVDLGYNFLNGTIPQDLWNLPSLKTIFLDHCNLTGSLPSYSEGTSMHRLWLDSNGLSGSIPSMLGLNWTKLYSIKLEENFFTGAITDEQCNRWEESLPTEEDFSSIHNSEKNNGSSRKKRWTFEVDCDIDCSCCTSTTNCQSNTSANINGRR